MESGTVWSEMTGTVWSEMGGTVWSVIATQAAILHFQHRINLPHLYGNHFFGDEVFLKN